MLHAAVFLSRQCRRDAKYYTGMEFINYLTVTAWVTYQNIRIYSCKMVIKCGTVLFLNYVAYHYELLDRMMMIEYGTKNALKHCTRHTPIANFQSYVLHHPYDSVTD